MIFIIFGNAALSSEHYNFLFAEPQTSSSKQPDNNLFGRVMNFKQYYERKTGSERQFRSNKTKKANVTEAKGKPQNQEVVITIGLMKWSDEYLKLRPVRGKRLALKVSKADPYKVLCDKAIEKWKAYNPDLYSEDEKYVLLLDSGKEAIFLPGPGKEFFSLGRYQEEVGKDFKRITLYLCTVDDYDHSEKPDYALENEDSDSAQDFDIPSKRPKEDYLNFDLINWDPTELQGTADLIGDDEKFALDLQRQFLGESSSQDPLQIAVDQSLVDQTAPTTHDVPSTNVVPNTNVIPTIHAVEETSRISTPQAYSTITDVVQALEKSVNKEKQFFITVRRGTPLPRILNLWRHEAKTKDVRNEFRVKFLEEDGIDTGALTREFFSDVVPAVGDMLFPNGTPLDSTHHVQNGNFRASGEIVASSLANGGPAPGYLDEKAFQSLVHPQLNVSDLDGEDGMTSTERQIIDSVKKDINLHVDLVREHGYTGLVDEAHIDDIVRSMKVSLVNKRILYLREFKEGLSLFDLSTILNDYLQLCRSLFVQGQLENVDAAYLFSLIQPLFSPVGSSRRQLEESLMDNFQDLLMALDDGEITGYKFPLVWNGSECQADEAVDDKEKTIPAEMFESADLSSAGVMKWLTGQRHRQLNGQKIKIEAKFDHECLIRNPAHSLCFPLVGACGRVITFPVCHMKNYETFKDVFLLGFCNGQDFAKP